MPQKPVSSLRARFEGLNANDVASNETQSKVGDRLDTPQPAGVGRVSLDLPRSESPRNLSKQGGGNHTPRTPREPRSRAESPTKATHKRPMSMQVGSSPQLTPSVNVESPKSPPRSFFVNRGVSMSPERSPLNRVQDLVSKHTSRSTSRPGTPNPDGGDKKALEENNGIRIVNERLGQHIEGTKIGSVPPPVNRTDKPKIPTKPAPLIASDLSALVPQDRKMSVERRVSPFSTPPSSGENSPTARGSPEPSKRRGSSQTGVARSQTITAAASQAVSRTPAVLTDPRHMGFAPPRSTERRDPRTLGLSAVLPRTEDKNEVPGGAPARANTVSTRSSARDARDTGFSIARPTPRHVSESVKPMPPPTRRENAPSPRAGPMRDPRQFGFSGPVSSITLAEEDRPGLPPRRAEPPPRPSAATKAGGHTQQHQPPQLSAVGKTIIASERLQPAPLKPPTENEGHFPPPPKRNTFPEPELVRPPVRPTPNAQSGPAIRVADQSRKSTRPPDPDDSDEMEEIVDEPVATRTDYPDSSQANRRPPHVRDSIKELLFKSDARVFDACGQIICTTGYATRVYDLSNADKVMEISHGETVKGLSVIFKPGDDFKSEGTRIWVGNNIGDLQEYDIATHSLVADSKAHNRREIVRILRHKKDLWTLDDAGNLFVWPAHEGKSPSLKYSHQSIRVQKGHTFSLVVQDQLWLASGKELRVYKPGHEASFAAVDKILTQPGTGEVTSGSYTTQQGGRAYFGHTDGKVTVYSIKDYTCLGNIKVSDYKINALAFVGDWLWAAYKTGKVYVYDTSTTPWKVKKDWKAHEGPAAGMLLDPSSIWTMQRLQVISLGQTDQCLRLWDGMLEDDWLETAMHDKDTNYCSFREIKAAVVTWNVGAANPMDVRPDFICDAIQPDDPPEILAFGFQEVVDLEDRAVTAKSILGFGKKKDKSHTDQPVGRVYREWSAFLAKCISRCMGVGVSYSELHTSSLIGLFQCIFVRSDVRAHVRNISAVDVKCGMKGHYGNKVNAHPHELMTQLTKRPGCSCYPLRPR